MVAAAVVGARGSVVPGPDDALPPPTSLTPTWSERWRAVRADPRTGTAVLVVLAVVAGAAWWLLGRDDAGVVDGAGPIPTDPPAITTAAPTTIVVHVAGAVAKPGIITLSVGARVADAIAAAGGPTADAQAEAMNLAAKVTDGQRIVVPRVGEIVLTPHAPDAGSTGESVGESTAEPAGPINLNSATKDALETLPGIGPTLADAIIAERESSGGFKTVDDLRNVRGIGDKRFADLQDLVTV